jgi:exodeoxyribonuclease VII large subunit
LITQRLSENAGVRTAMYLNVRNKVAIESAQLSGAITTLRALSPQGTLERGFSIVRNANNEIVKSSLGVNAGEELRIKFAEGELEVRVNEI